MLLSIIIQIYIMITSHLKIKPYIYLIEIHYQIFEDAFQA